MKGFPRNISNGTMMEIYFKHFITLWRWKVYGGDRANIDFEYDLNQNEMIESILEWMEGELTQHLNIFPDICAKE